MTDHPVVSDAEWLDARRELLEMEKEYTRLRDRISARRRALPWKKIETDYQFEGPDGKESLSDLFGGRSQLVIVHFMFDPSWEEGCKSCSFMADHYDPAVAHLAARDVSLVAVSRAPLYKLQEFRDRMGWNFKWVSSYETGFNRDFFVTFTPEERDEGDCFYNFSMGGFPVAEAPGISIFAKDADGQVFHTYSVYARGLESCITTYDFLDMVPKGRDEAALSYTMEWVRHHDKYEETS